MNMQEATVAATGEGATIIVLCEHGPFDGRRYDAGLAADVQDFALIVFVQNDCLSIATVKSRY